MTYKQLYEHLNFRNSLEVIEKHFVCAFHKRWASAWSSLWEDDVPQHLLPYRHLSFVILASDESDTPEYYTVFMQELSCNHNDQYNRKRGFQDTMSKALAKAAGLIPKGQTTVLKHTDFLIDSDDIKKLASLDNGHSFKSNLMKHVIIILNLAGVSYKPKAEFELALVNYNMREEANLPY